MCIVRSVMGFTMNSLKHYNLQVDGVQLLFVKCLG